MPIDTMTITIEAGPYLTAAALRLCAALEAPSARPSQAAAAEPPHVDETPQPEALQPEPTPPQPIEAPIAAAPELAITDPAVIPAPLAPEPRRGKVWTPERLELMRRDYPSGRPLQELWRALLALPGLPITHQKHLGIKAHGLNISRNGRPRDPADAPAVVDDGGDEHEADENDEDSPAPTLDPPNGFETVTFSTAYAWAGQRGLATHREGMDLARVNEKRLDLGLRPFAITRHVAS